MPRKNHDEGSDRCNLRAHLLCLTAAENAIVNVNEVANNAGSDQHGKLFASAGTGCAGARGGCKKLACRALHPRHTAVDRATVKELIITHVLQASRANLTSQAYYSNTACASYSTDKTSLSQLQTCSYCM
jgi:hypothetical protein